MSQTPSQQQFRTSRTCTNTVLFTYAAGLGVVTNTADLRHPHGRVPRASARRMPVCPCSCSACAVPRHITAPQACVYFCCPPASVTAGASQSPGGAPPSAITHNVKLRTGIHTMLHQTSPHIRAAAEQQQQRRSLSPGSFLESGRQLLPLSCPSRVALRGLLHPAMHHGCLIAAPLCECARWLPSVSASLHAQGGYTGTQETT